MAFAWEPLMSPSLGAEHAANSRMSFEGTVCMHIIHSCAIYHPVVQAVQASVLCITRVTESVISELFDS